MGDLAGIIEEAQGYFGIPAFLLYNKRKINYLEGTHYAGFSTKP
jgi:hypothetical protein